MTHEQRKVHHAKRRNRAAALLQANPHHLRAKTEKPLKGRGSYARVSNRRFLRETC
jgi:stalled ribosome alternative rescue factor ArfA